MSTIDDLKISLIRSYLKEVGSDLLGEADDLSLVNICRQMQIVDGELTEGRGTGIPKIKRVMMSNGSPEPSFRTDDVRSHFLVVLPMHRDFSIDSSSDELLSLTPMESNILEILEAGELGRNELAHRLGVSSRAGSMKRAIDRLTDVKLIEFTLPETPRSPNQRLRLPAKKRDS